MNTDAKIALAQKSLLKLFPFFIVKINEWQNDSFFFTVIVVAVGVFALPYSLLHLEEDLWDEIPKVSNISNMSEDVGSTYSAVILAVTLK